MTPTSTNKTPTASGLKKSDLYEIALKIFGFYFLVLVLTQLKQVIVFLISAQLMEPMMGRDVSSLTLLWPSLLGIVIDVWLTTVFLFRTKKILTMMVPRSQSETVEFALNKPALIQVAAIIVGGLMIVGAVEKTGYNLISMVQIAGSPFEAEGNVIMQLIWDIVLGIAGYALIAGSGWIAERFSARTTGTASSDVSADARFQFGQWKITPTAFKKKRPSMPKRRQQVQ